MPSLLVYGKIIVDSIRLLDGGMAYDVLGGGGPQAALGARLWEPSVGLLSRAGDDLEPVHRVTLEDLAVDLEGVAFYPDLPSLRGATMAYDENEYSIGMDDVPRSPLIQTDPWLQVLGRPLALPPGWEKAKLIHLVTEYTDDPMMRRALAMRREGTCLSLEPIIDHRTWENREEILALLPHVDIVTPDWPSASGIAGSKNPRDVVAFWSRLGPSLVAIRHGHNGSYVWDRQHDAMWHIAPIPVQAVDPTGAGNAYGGGLAAGWLASADARHAGVCGAVAASTLVERVGIPAHTPELATTVQSRLREGLMRAVQL